MTDNGYALTESVSSFIPGSYPITAQYFGDASFKSSSSPIVSFTVTQAATTISLTPLPNTQGVTLTAFVGTAGNGNANPPSGSITFYSGNTSLGSAPVTQLYGPNGTLQPGANLNDPQLANGQYSMTAELQWRCQLSSFDVSPGECVATTRFLIGSLS